MTKTDETTLILKYDLSIPREADKITKTAKINPWTGFEVNGIISPNTNGLDSDQKQVAEKITRFLNSLPFKELSVLAENLDEVEDSSEEDNENSALVMALTEGKKYSKEERQQLEWQTFVNRFQWYRKLFQDCCNLAQVAELLEITPQTVRERVASQSLLAITHNGNLLFPKWQFEPDTHNGVIEGLPEVLATLKISTGDKIGWLIRPNPILEQRTPIEALKQGEKNRVLDEARGVGIL